MQYTIYVSSTFSDLKTPREHAIRALRGLRHQVLAMEDYGAADERPLDRCLADVARSDLYVGIFAWRYGFVPRKGNPERLSITELEYREAGRLGTPRLIFMLDRRAAWPPDLLDSSTGENEKGARILRLRQRIERDRLVSRFETSEQLATRVVSALYNWQLGQALEVIPQVAPEGGPPSAAAAPQSHARGRSRALWQPGSRLRVRFLEGSPLLRERVLRLAQIWCAYANIRFEPSDDADAEVRVAFVRDAGTWAYQGPAALEVAVSEATMNLDWVNEDSPITDLESVVLGTFGSVLGLAREHNNPDGDIDWNKEAVYDELTAVYGSRERVDFELFTKWSADYYPIRKPFDPLSITAFPIPARWLKSGVAIPGGSAISPGDREFIARLYPYPTRGVEPAATRADLGNVQALGAEETSAKARRRQTSVRS